MNIPSHLQCDILPACLKWSEAFHRARNQLPPGAQDKQTQLLTYTMKKTLIALMTLSSIAFATTPTTVTGGSITLDGTQAADARLDFTYSDTASQVVTTTADLVNIEGSDGFGLTTLNTTVTFNIQNVLAASGTMKLASGAGGKINVNTSLTLAEMATLEGTGVVSRQVVTADIFTNISNKTITLTLAGMDGYNDGGVIFYQSATNKYYNYTDVTFNGNYASVNSGAAALDLADGTIYTTLKIGADGGASVKGIGFVATALIPEPTTATLSLLALAGLAARRRRK